MSEIQEEEQSIARYDQGGSNGDAYLWGSAEGGSERPWGKRREIEAPKPEAQYK